MTSDDDLIQDLFRRFATNKESSNTDSNITASSNHVSSNKSETEVYNINSNSS